MNAFAINLKAEPKPQDTTVQDEEDSTTEFVFETMEEGFKPVVRQSFKEAFADMYHWVCKMLDDGNLSLQVLETAIWIKGPYGICYLFNQARNKAIREGILIGSKLAE